MYQSKGIRVRVTRGLVVACNMLQSRGQLWDHQNRMLDENSQPNELSHETPLSTPPASHTTDHHQWVNNKANFIYIKHSQAITLWQQYTPTHTHTQDTVETSVAEKFTKQYIIYCILSSKVTRAKDPLGLRIWRSVTGYKAKWFIKHHIQQYQQWWFFTSYSRSSHAYRLQQRTAIISGN